METRKVALRIRLHKIDVRTAWFVGDAPRFVQVL